jgi:hypothetical protein
VIGRVAGAISAAATTADDITSGKSWKQDLADGAGIAASLMPGGGAAASEESTALSAVEGDAAASETTAADTVRMRHYTNSKGKAGITESGVIQASDQNKVFLMPARGKLLSPRDAESTLGIGRGRGNNVLEFDVPADRVYSRYNSTMNINEWVADGDLEVTNIKVVR